MPSSAGSRRSVLDIPPYVSAAGNRAQLYGLNLVGLKRKGFSDAGHRNA